MWSSSIQTVFVIISCLHILSTVCDEPSKFPLGSCTETETDLLLVADTVMPGGCIGPPELKMLLAQIVDMFLPPEDQPMTRLRVGLVSDTSSGPVTVFQFQDSNSSEQIKEIFSNLTTCDKTQHSQSIRESTVLSTVDFVYKAFSEEKGSRTNASHVAVMLVSGPKPGTVDDVYKVQNGIYYPNIKLFIILVGFTKEVSSSKYIPNILSFPSFASLPNNQLISMAICKRCKPGWFLFEHRNPFHHLSCYFFNSDSNTPSDWFSATNRCQMIGSNLTSIETQEELDFLQEKLYETLTKREADAHKWTVFIGLRRNYAALPKQFDWINGHPLVVSHWLEKSPRGGYSQECGIWKFQAPDFHIHNQEQLNFSVYEEMYKNGWDDIGCGVPRSNLGLCEIALASLNSGQERSLEISRVREESTQSALSRGEFVEFHDRIVSVAANAESDKFCDNLRQQNVEFQLFDCHEDGTKGKLISFSYVCDHISHCKNNRDEDLCLYRQCDYSKEYECRSHQCVPRESRCDVYGDCFDNSDEEDCTECKQRRCCDGTCVPRHWFNAEIDCSSCNQSGTSVNGNATENLDQSCAFICNRTACVSDSQIGDGILDCAGPEGPLDEVLGKLERVNSCNGDVGRNVWAPRCVYVKDRYGLVLGCRDMSHLWNCKNFSCPEGYVKCPGSYCIPLHFVLDGNMDCPQGEDEQYLNDHNCSGNFDCWNSHVCVHPDLVCDGVAHCPYRDDEQNCAVICREGFQCIAGTVSVTTYNRSSPLESLAFIDRRTRHLDLSGINVSSAFSRQEKRHLASLVVILLSRSKIASIEDSFVSDAWDLQSLYHLDVSYNLFKKIPRNNVFRFMTNLRILDVSHNSYLTDVDQNAFQTIDGKSVLEHLDLSFTSISFLHNSALKDLINLKILDLSHTQIYELSTDTFPSAFKLQILDLRYTTIQDYNSNSFNALSVELHFYTDNFGLCCPQIRGTGITDEVCHAPSDPISSCTELMKDTVQRILLWLVGSIAVLGNLTVIACRLMWNKSVIGKAYGMFVTNLGISDLVMGLYLLMIAGADMYYRGTYITNSIVWKHSIVCRIAGFLSTLSSETSAFFVLLVTIDRYLVIKFPFGEHSFSRRTMFLASAMAWTFGFSLALIPSLPVFNSWSIYYSNGMCLGLPLTTEKLGGWEYSVSVFVGVNTAMSLFIAFGQFSIYRALSGNRAAKSAVHNSNRRAQDIAVAKQLSLVVLTDFLCYFPVGILGLLAITGHEIGKAAYAWSAVLILPINSAINPVLYTVPVIQSKWEQFKRGHYLHRSGGDRILSSKGIDLTTLSRGGNYNCEQNVI